MAGRMGATVTLANPSGIVADHLLFSETGARAVVSVREAVAAKLLELAGGMGVDAAMAGRVGGEGLKIAVDGADAGVDITLTELSHAYEGALPCAMGR